MNVRADQDARWSPVAELWQEVWGSLADPARELLIQRAGVAPGDRVLDVGCGSGELLARLQTLGAIALANWAEDERNDLDTVEYAVCVAEGEQPRPGGPLREDDERIARMSPVVLAAAEPFVTPSGYRFVNAFRWAVARS